MRVKTLSLAESVEYLQIGAECVQDGVGGLKTECPQMNTNESSLHLVLRACGKRKCLLEEGQKNWGGGGVQNESRTKWTCSHVSAGCACASSQSLMI